jgi:hypothetical protein
VAPGAVHMMSADECATCGGAGFLLDQSYGFYVEPAPLDPGVAGPGSWVPVQACDDCRRFLSDLFAALATPFHRRGGPAVWCPGFVDADTGERMPGDWVVWAS